MFLNCKTFFSFRYGTYSTEELVNHAASLGVQTMALTNINNTCDLWDFVDFCQKKNIKPVAGAEVHNQHGVEYLLLAKSNEGLKEINRFLSIHLEAKQAFPSRPELSTEVAVIYPLESIIVDELKENEWVGVQPTEVNKLYKCKTHLHPKKYVVRHPVTFANVADYHLHRLLRAIDKNSLLSLQEPQDIAQKHERFVPIERIEKAFLLYPFIIENTWQLLNECSISLEFHKDKNKNAFTASREDDRILLEKLAQEGMVYRYGRNNKEAKQRVQKELKVIHHLGFNAYFLITHDVIRYAQNRKFYYVGRGSGANSIVAYCLQITDVDPIKLDLYFERFLNQHRTSPPDFDMDFSWKDRDEIIDYIFKKYGREHVALLGMYSTFQHNAVVRELGKVFGLPKAEIDSLSGNRYASYSEDCIQQLILKYGRRLISFPNHLSIHPGGMLISEAPIHTYCATELPPKGFVTSQLDMFIAEKVGLYKLDILSQRGLGHIKDALGLIKQNKGIEVDIHQVEKFMSDPKVADQIRRADTIGCFYIESPAMRQLLTKLRCDNYLTLVAASSIIRPGVAQSGMMREYIHRFHHPEAFNYLHPIMEEHLKETYGVMVYQEDVIKIAHHFAGLDMAEADILRRAMSGKYRGDKEMQRIQQKFFNGAAALGRPAAISAEVWRQIESFGGYSFSKAHSASFAVESYQSLYLKTYFPIEFMVAVINNFGGFYSTELYFHELKRAGAKVHLPCINRSEELTRVNGTDVYMGLIHIQGLEEKVKKRILHERIQGAYTDLTDFIERTQIGIQQLNNLIQIGALRFTGKNKKELLWQANFIQKQSYNQSTVNALFSIKPIEFQLPELQQLPLDDALDEIELLGFPLCHPFELIENRDGYVPAANFPQYIGKEIKALGYLITTKPVRTIKKENMFFGTFIDPNGDWLDTVHFPQSVFKYPLQGKGYYSMAGKVIEEFGVFTLDVHQMQKLGIKQMMV